MPLGGMPGSHSKISVTAFGQCSHAAAANRVRDETSSDTPGDVAVAGHGRVNRE
jgi:hypothetical protein